MSRSNTYENNFDPEDDGSDIEITEEEQAASDDQGREEALVCVRTGHSVHGNGKYDEQHRRMWYRLAKKALADGRERREEADRAEKARAKAAADEAVKEEADRKHAARFRRWCDGFDARMAALDEQTRRENAEWEAGRPAREAAERAAASALTTQGSKGDGRATELAPSWQRGDGRATLQTTPPVEMAKPRPAPTGKARATPRAIDPLAASPSRRWESPSAKPLNPPSTLPALPTAKEPTTRPPSTPTSAPPRAAPHAPPRSMVPTPTRSSVTPSPARQVRTPANPPVPTLPSSRPLPPPPLPAAPAAPEPPPFTGADLAAYRASLGLSQGLLAARLGTTQGTVSKAEGNPTALLGPTLRSAMWSAQRGAGGAASR